MIKRLELESGHSVVSVAKVMNLLWNYMPPPLPVMCSSRGA